MLILCYTGQAATVDPSISSISQTGVTWSKAAAENNPATMDTEIWYGVVGSGAGTSITVTVASGSGGLYSEIADVCEWAGLATSSPVDKTATNAGTQSTSGNSGTTATTTQASELWIGAIGAGAVATGHVAQSSPTNSFTLLDGAQETFTNIWSSMGYSYKIASATGTSSVGTSFAAAAFWSGCIATFFAASTSTTPSLVQG
jgi:hypothetical protein